MDASHEPTDAVIQQQLSTALERSSRGELDWVEYYREILGVDGVLRHLCPSPGQMAQFAKTEEYRRIQRTLTALRARRANDSSATEPTAVITIRLPASVHEALKTEADEHHTSLNRLCISKLIQIVDEELVPTRRRTRRRTKRNGLGVDV
jgi:hypothetical protein